MFFGTNSSSILTVKKYLHIPTPDTTVMSYYSSKVLSTGKLYCMCKTKKGTAGLENNVASTISDTDISATAI